MLEVLTQFKYNQEIKMETYTDLPTANKSLKIEVNDVFCLDEESGYWITVTSQYKLHGDTIYRNLRLPDFTEGRDVSRRSILEYVVKTGGGKLTAKEVDDLLDKRMKVLKSQKVEAETMVITANNNISDYKKRIKSFTKKL